MQIGEADEPHAVQLPVAAGRVALGELFLDLLDRILRRAVVLPDLRRPREPVQIRPASGCHSCDRSVAAAQCRNASSTSTTTASFGGLEPSPACRSSVEGSRVRCARPLTRSVSPKPGSRNSIPACPVSTMLRSESARRLPLASPKTRLAPSSETSTKPGLPPRGDTSSRPFASTVPSRAKGERAIKSRQCPSRRLMFLPRAKVAGLAQQCRDLLRGRDAVDVERHRATISPPRSGARGGCLRRAEGLDRRGREVACDVARPARQPTPRGLVAGEGMGVAWLSAPHLTQPPVAVESALQPRA